MGTHQFRPLPPRGHGEFETQGQETGGARRQPRYAFSALGAEGDEEFDRVVREKAAGVEAEATVEGAWGRIKDAVMVATEQVVPIAPKKPRRAWISEGTMELLEYRKSLAEAGLLKDMGELDNVTKIVAK